MKTIKLSDVKVSEDFLKNKPKETKVSKATKYIEQYGRLDKPIVLKNGVLVDNYARYLAAQSFGLLEVPYVELNCLTYIIGKFDRNDKEYTWKNDKNIDIKVGDKVKVGIKHKDRKWRTSNVTVMNIFVSDSLELYNKHKSVVGKKINTN